MERFVIIDDDAINNIKCRFVINKVINGAEIYTFLSAKEGLVFLADDEPPKNVRTFVFLDINMPGMDGWQALEEFEKIPEKTKTKTRIFMLSSSIDPADFRRAASIQRIMEYIEKPFTIEKFEEIIRKYR